MCHSNVKKRRPLQNIVSIAPGPTAHSKHRIHTAFKAFRILRQNYDELDCERHRNGSKQVSSKPSKHIFADKKYQFAL